jgi:hypothetical protein
MNIGFDLDGCIVDMSSMLLSIISEKTGEIVRQEDIVNYRIEDNEKVKLSKVEVDSVVDEVLTNQQNLQAYPGALGFLYQYYEKYHRAYHKDPVFKSKLGELIFITSRNEKYRNETERWLTDNIPGIPYTLIMTKDKIGECMNYKLDYFIEDNVEWFFKFITDDYYPPDAFNTTILVPIRSWNAEFRDFFRGSSYFIEFAHWPTLYKLFITFCRS